VSGDRPAGAQVWHRVCQTRIPRPLIRLELLVIRLIFRQARRYVPALGLMTYVVWSNWKPGGQDGLAAVWQHHAVERAPIRVSNQGCGQ